MVGDVVEPRERHVNLDPEVLTDVSFDRAFVGLDLGADVSRFLGRQAVERERVAFVPELIDFRLREDLGHISPPSTALRSNPKYIALVTILFIRAPESKREWAPFTCQRDRRPKIATQ